MLLGMKVVSKASYDEHACPSNYAEVLHLQGGEHRLHDFERCQQLEATVALHLQYTIQSSFAV